MRGRVQLENFPSALLGGLTAVIQERFNSLAVKFSVRNGEQVGCRSFVGNSDDEFFQVALVRETGVAYELRIFGILARKGRPRIKFCEERGISELVEVEKNNGGRVAGNQLQQLLTLSRVRVCRKTPGKE